MKPQLWKSNDGALPGAVGQPRFLINGSGAWWLTVVKSNQQIGGFSLSFSQGVLCASRRSFRAALRDVLLYPQLLLAGALPTSLLLSPIVTPADAGFYSAAPGVEPQTRLAPLADVRIWLPLALLLLRSCRHPFLGGDSGFQMRWKTSSPRTLRPATKALPLATIVVGLTKRPDQLVVTLQSDVQFLEL